ncbi:ATP-binding cassette domain-containing protein, partial [Serratia marcescens]|uniref:ATP-binding cassette domain-containing protein n=2 Tax=Serratia TaxID=613 RepID=UPI003F8148DF
APNGTLTVNQLAASAPGGSAPVLHGVSFRLEAGEVLGVIGASGSGKTLLMRQLVGALTPLSGDVRLDGADLRQWDKQQLGPHIGYLPQDIQLFAGTLTENIARFGQVDAEKVVAAAALAGVHQLILHLPKGYETELGEGGSGLSGGQRQRVALARALYGSPALVVLDEPNANLDREGEEALQRAIEALKKRGTTIVLVTHKPAILATTDRLLVLAAGQVQHFGPSDAILKKLPGFTPATVPANAGRSSGGGFNVNYANFAKTASGERKV